MSRYIDADALERILMEMDENELCEDCCYNVVAKLDEQPTAEVVEVVRCKDCTWWKSIFSWNGKEHKVCVR